MQDVCSQTQQMQQMIKLYFKVSTSNVQNTKEQEIIENLLVEKHVFHATLTLTLKVFQVGLLSCLQTTKFKSVKAPTSRSWGSNRGI